MSLDFRFQSLQRNRGLRFGIALWSRPRDANARFDRHEKRIVACYSLSLLQRCLFGSFGTIFCGSRADARLPNLRYISVVACEYEPTRRVCDADTRLCMTRSIFRAVARPPLVVADNVSLPACAMNAGAHVPVWFIWQEAKRNSMSAH